MIYEEETALKAAGYLLQIKAIKLNPANPFTWASGWKSPIYCDNRKSLSYPPIRTYLKQQMASAVTKAFDRPEVIAGVATAGIPLGVLVAQELGLPFIYVRSAPKDHGLENLIEGVLEPNQNVVIIEDLISTGGSSLKAVEAVRKAGGKVLGMAAVFSYGFPQAVEAFKKADCELVTLSDYAHLITEAVQSGYVEEKELEVLSSWRTSPDTWGK